ncbi:MAG TPA: hypothetical protein VGO68_01665 [Pyrinomonadaceae bacterium]|jgi:hypothetical protein|nr:hypothetical protein [Pyrinomonadaceae bacterium]
MKIYFAASIRGGRDDWSTYLEIVKQLREYGEVLTEHVGNVELSAVGEDRGNIFDLMSNLNEQKVVANFSSSLCQLCVSVVENPSEHSPLRHREHRGYTEDFKLGHHRTKGAIN